MNVISRVLVGLLPVWVLLFLAFAVPGSIEPIGSNPPAVAGLPLGIILVGAALVVMALGVEVLRQTSSTTSVLLTLAFLTLPSAAAVVLAPTLVLTMQSPSFWMPLQ